MTSGANDTFPTSECRSCRKQVIWATTVKGKPMPVDAEPSAAGNVLLQLVAGDVAAIVTKAPVPGGRLSHFVTCPNAAEWRNKAWKPTAPDDEPNTAARDEGIAQVSQGREGFIDACCRYIEGFDQGFDFTADRVAWWAHREGLEAAHPNLFGAVFRAAKTRGLIEATGDFVESKQKSRRSGAIRVWRRR